MKKSDQQEEVKRTTYTTSDDRRVGLALDPHQTGSRGFYLQLP
jgi:hypothetical protein